MRFVGVDVNRRSVELYSPALCGADLTSVGAVSRQQETLAPRGDVALALHPSHSGAGTDAVLLQAQRAAPRSWSRRAASRQLKDAGPEEHLGDEALRSGVTAAATGRMRSRRCA